MFHLGYQRFALPIWFRKLFAKTAIHREWLSGFYGGGIIGVLERHKDTLDFIHS